MTDQQPETEQLMDVQPLPWHFKRHPTGMVGIYDANGILVTGNLTVAESRLVCQQMNLLAAATPPPAKPDDVAACRYCSKWGPCPDHRPTEDAPSLAPADQVRLNQLWFRAVQQALRDDEEREAYQIFAELLAAPVERKDR